MPKKMRSGGFSASTTLRIAPRVAVGSLGLSAEGRLAAAFRTSAYSASSSLRDADGPDQSVEKPPGSTNVTLIPKPATSCASDCEKPSSAHSD